MTVKKRPITIEDLTKLKHVEDPRISPDGQWIAYVQVAPDMMERGYTRNIWLAPTGGGAPVQLTRGGKDSQPRWAPDGSALAFTSNRNDKPQIYLLPLTAPGGEARALTSARNGASSPAWSPDGKYIAYLSSMNAEERAEEDSGEKPEPPRDKLEAKQRKERADEDRKAYFDPLHVTRIPYREGTSYRDNRYRQVYVITTAEDPENGEARRLTDVDADYGQPYWSTDGKQIFTARKHTPEADSSFADINIYTLDITTGAETRWHADDDYSYYAAMPSPDGKWVASVRGADNDLATLGDLVLFPAGGGDMRILTEGFDRSVSAVDWSPNGVLYAVVPSDGDYGVHRVDPEKGEFIPVVTGPFAIEGFSIGADGGVAFAAGTPRNPGELYYQRPGTEKADRMTDLNRAFLEEVFVQPVNEVRFQSPDGGEIQGWYILPPDFEAGKQYPLALNIHGGPRVMWSPAARGMFHEWQVHAARGYVVFFCNPRGGDGYGLDHMRALLGDWGDVAMKDIMAGVDHMLNMGIIDEKRMAITGGSYGGYMTAWIVGHTDRFASAVSQRGVYNLVSFYGTSDVPRLISNDFSVEPWEDHELLWKHSPLAYAHKVKTPLLIIHSENDFRVPIEQGEQLYAWVHRATDTPVKLIRFPREGHELSRSGEPQHRISRLTEMVNWFDQYCQPDK